MSDTTEQVSKTGNVETFHQEGSDLVPDKTVEEMKKWVREQFEKGEKKTFSDLWDLFKTKFGVKNGGKFSKALDELVKKGEFIVKKKKVGFNEENLGFIYLGG